MLRYYFLFLSIAISFLVSGQELPPLKNFSPGDYDAGNQNWMISQDADGRIFAANNEGLLSYNGAQWVLHDSPNSSILRSVAVIGDRVYTGMYMDFGYWQVNPESSLQYTSLLNDSGIELLEDEQFWNVVDTQNYIFFQSLDGIYTYSKTDGTVQRIIDESGIQKIFKIGESLYYQVLSRGLFQIVNNTGVLINDSLVFKEERVISFFENNGFIKYITENGVIDAAFENDHAPVDLRANYKGLKVYSALHLKNGSILLGTVAHGLLQLDQNGNINLHVNRSNGLSNNTILSLYQDMDSNVWCGLDNGISFLNLDTPYRTFVDQAGVIGTVYCSAIYDGKIYVGSNQGVFSKSQADSESIFELIPGTAGQAWSLSVLDDRLYCSHDSGLFEIDSNRANLIFDKVGVWCMMNINSQTEGEVQIIGTYSGLYLIDIQKDGKVTSKHIDNFDISSRDVVYQDDAFYVNHEYKGLYKLDIDLTNGKLMAINQIDYLTKSANTDISLLNGNQMAYSNDQGIFLFSESDGKFTRTEQLSEIVLEEGYSSGRIIQTQDMSNWVFAQDAVLRIKIQELDGSYQVDRYDLGLGVRNEMTGYENITMLSEDVFLIGTANGYLLLDTSYNSPISHEVNIESVHVVDETGDQTRLISGSVLPSDVNSLEISLMDASYKALTPTYYQYKMPGLIEYWSDWSESPIIDLNNLPSGEFLVQTRSRIGAEVSQNVAEFGFKIEKPFYFSNIAIALYALVLILGVAGINLFYSNYYKRKKAKVLERQQREMELIKLSSDNEMKQLRNDKLRDEIKYRNNELAVSTMGMLRKNEALTEISNAVKRMTQSPEVKSLKKLVDKNLTNKQEWISFEEAFNNADKDFFKKIKTRHPSLTTGDLRLCTYLRLNLSSKEIAPLLNISPRSVEIKRYRLRKKMELSKDDSLTDYILNV